MSLVSILVAAYNAERWVSAAIESALCQSWPRKELIFVDDGSTDRTLEIAQAFEGGVMKVVSQENRGAAAARNRALSLAQGSYIQWLDADDLLDPQKIAIQMRVAREVENPWVLLSSSFGHFYFDWRKAEFRRTVLWQDLRPVDWIISKSSYKMCGMNPAVWLVSRELTDRAGPWDESLSLNDDGEYFCRVVARSRFVRFVPEARSFYRQWTAGSLNKRTSRPACESLLRSLSLCIDQLLSLEDSERTRKAAVKSLQARMHYFYPEQGDLLERLRHMAEDLGGTLCPPTLSWKYDVLRRCLGWKRMRWVGNRIRSAKLHLLYEADRVGCYVRSGQERARVTLEEKRPRTE